MNRPVIVRTNSWQWSWGTTIPSKKKTLAETLRPNSAISNTKGKRMAVPFTNRKIVDELDEQRSQRSTTSSSKSIMTFLETIDEYQEEESHEESSWEDGDLKPTPLADDEPSDSSKTPPRTLSNIVHADIMSSQDVADYFHEQYTAFVTRQAETEHRLPLDVVLDASTRLLEEFVSVCPQNRMDREMIHCELDAYVFPRISLVYADISKLKTSEVAKLISWAHHYQSSLTPMGIDIPKARLCDFEELVTEYLKRGVHDQMNLMIQNSLLLLKKEQVKEDENGQLVTCHPEDIAFMVEMQMSVARESLPRCFWSEVLTACNEEVFNMIADIMLDVESRWKDMGVERLCSIINDASRLSEQCDERNEEILDTSNLNHVKTGNDLCKDLTELALHATRYLCERIMLDLRDPDRILTRVGDPCWESEQDVSVVDTTIVTLKDYFEDIHEWLPHDYFFPKCVKHCFDMTMQMYVHSFFSNTMAHGMDDPVQASHVLQKDWRKLLKFFQGDTGEYAGQAGHYTRQAMMARLDLLQALAHLLTPTTPPDQLEMELQTVVVQLGGVDSASPALLHIAGLRQRGITTKKARAKEAMWHETLERVTTHLDEMLPSNQESSSTFAYKLPDVRNSEYLRRIQLSGNSASSRTLSSTKSASNRSNKNNNKSTKKLSRWNSLVKRPGLGQSIGASFRASRRRMGWTPTSDRDLISTWRPHDEQQQQQQQDERDGSSLSTATDSTSSSSSSTESKSPSRRQEFRLNGSKLSQRAK